jgi:hypothetical protein
MPVQFFPSHFRFRPAFGWLTSLLLLLAGVALALPPEEGYEAESIMRLPPRAEVIRGTSPADHGAANRRLSQAPSKSEPKSESSGPPIFRARPGPWGDLDYFTVYLEASVATLKSMDLPTYDTVWKFVGYTEDQVTKLFESVKMPAEIQAELLDPKKWRREGEIISVFPSNEAVLGLSAEARGAIYQVLGRWEENPFHHEPDVIAGNDVRVWLQRANLSEEVLSTIEKTVYQRGKNLVFADQPLVLRMVPSEEERLKIRKALSRTPTLVVKLRLTPETDVAKIADYWVGYTRTKDVLPFLESMSQISVTNMVDIVHLLPTGVRRLLYTFPSQNHGRSGYYPDCHWSSLNFANFDPLDRLADPAMATAYTLENYTRVTSGEAYRYGDVLFFMDGNTGNAIHSCVYLADDIVYTKNGRSPLQPWVLMKLDEVVAFYAMFYQPQIACYRRKTE